MGRTLKIALKKIKEPKVLVSIFLASIMIFSVLGFMMSYSTSSNDNTKKEYPNFFYPEIHYETPLFKTFHKNA